MTRRRLLVLGLLALAGGTILLATLPAGNTAIVRSVAIGADPQDVAVAPRLGRVFVVAQGDTSLRMLDATSGRLLATSAVPGTPDTILVGERARRVWVTTDFGNLGLYDARSGASVATIAPNDTMGVSVSRLVADPPRRHVVIASVNGFGSSANDNGDGYVSIMDAHSGTLLHIVRVGKDPGALAIDQRTARIFVASSGPSNNAGNPIGPGSVSVLDARTGRLMHTVSVGIRPDWLGIDEASNRVFVANGALTGTGSLSILDATSGRLLRSVPVGSCSRCSSVPMLDQRHGHIFVASSQGLLMLNTHDGRLLRLVHIPPEPWINFLMLDERRDRVIVVAGADVMLVDARSGALVRDVHLASSVGPLFRGAGPIALDERTGRLYVTQIGPMLPQATLYLPANPAGMGTVRVLDVRTGALIKIIAVGLMPDLVAVDEQTGRAFVVNAGCPDPKHPCGPAQSTPWGWLPSGLRHWLPWAPSPVHVETGGTVSVVNAAQ